MKKFFCILLLLFVFVVSAVNCSRNSKKEVKAGTREQLVKEVSDSSKEEEEKIQRRKEEEIAELQERLAEPQPENSASAEEYFLAVWNWRESIYSFALYRRRPEGYKDAVDRELERRSKVLVAAIENYLTAAKGKPLPDCQGIDPMYSVDSLWWGKLLNRELLIKILKVQTRDELKCLRSHSWDDQEPARFYWRYTTSRYGFTEAELKELGLNRDEIVNILH